jgi:hypothetical protein
LWLPERSLWSCHAAEYRQRRGRRRKRDRGLGGGCHLECGGVGGRAAAAITRAPGCCSGVISACVSQDSLRPSESALMADTADFLLRTNLC